MRYIKTLRSSNSPDKALWDGRQKFLDMLSRHAGIRTSKICMTAGSGKIERNELAGVVADSFPCTRPLTTIDDMIIVEAIIISKKLAATVAQAMANNLTAAGEIP